MKDGGEVSSVPSLHIDQVKNIKCLNKNQLNPKLEHWTFLNLVSKLSNVLHWRKRSVFDYTNKIKSTFLTP